MYALSSSFYLIFRPKADALDVNELIYLKQGDVVLFSYSAIIFVNTSTDSTPKSTNNITTNGTSTGIVPTLPPTPRPENYTVLVLPDGSAFSLVFMEKAKASRNWKASITNDKPDGVGETLLGPWIIAVDTENGPFGGGSSGKSTSFRTTEDGLYLLMLKTVARNITGTFSVTFKVGDNVLCSSIQNCKVHCNQTFFMSCYANISQGHDIEIHIMNSQPGTIIANVKRTITKVSSEFNGINARLENDHVIDNHLRDSLDQGNWRRVGQWKYDGFGLFLEGIISSRNAFVFTQAGSYQVLAIIQVMYFDANRTCIKDW